MPLKKECLLMAKKEIESNSLNYAAYAAVIRELKALGETVEEDPKFMEKYSKEGELKKQRFLEELNAYKQNMIKESIRLGFNELASHLVEIGLYSEALHTLLKSREVCSNSTHVIRMLTEVVRVAFLNDDYNNVVSYANRIEQTIKDANSLPPTSPNITTSAYKMAESIKVYKAISFMLLGNFEEASRLFLDIDCVALMNDQSFSTKSSISFSEVALYSVLTLLPSSSMNTKRTKLINKDLLELDPIAKDIYESYLGNKYERTMKTVESLMETDFIVDYYLNPVIEPLIKRIKKTFLLEYVVPFKSIKLDHLRTIFGDGVVDSLLELGETNALKFKLDLVEDVLHLETESLGLSSDKDYYQALLPSKISSLIEDFELKARQAILVSAAYHLNK
jgi:COP9 signalosome complex subunit 1